MVGRALWKYCESMGDEVYAYDRSQLDITNATLVDHKISDHRPDAVINCAAWTDVDGCERDPAQSDAINATGPTNLAKASRTVDAVFVTISTDYVFDGAKEGFYTQDDRPNPISVYGLSKLRGEQQATLINPRTIIVRSGFIFGPGGKNFLSKIPTPLSEKQQVNAISDAWGTPTYGLDLAVRLRELAKLDQPGIYHVVNEGPGASYVDFAVAVAEELRQDASLVNSVLSNTLQRPAARPRNSRLRCLVSEARGLKPLPFWRDAVREYLISMGFSVANA
jgi:dTDP-4-dehydrorhamnose reductase